MIICHTQKISLFIFKYFTNICMMNIKEEESLPVEIQDDEKIHVVRNLNISKIHYYGFDMDFTLCEYVSTEFDNTVFFLAKHWMVSQLNYSTNILDIPYDPEFAMCGLWYDKENGNILKVDLFGKILSCWHGTRKMEVQEILTIYPSKIQRRDKERIFIFETLYNVAEAYLVAVLIDQEVKSPQFGLSLVGRQLSFRQLIEDVKHAWDAILSSHSGNVEMPLMKKAVVEDLPRFVNKDDRLPLVLRRIKENDGKTFLVTNSDWRYANIIMTFLLGSSWVSFFDLVLVDARKPLFFSTGSQLKYVDTKTCSVKDKSMGDPVVYSGGDHNTVTRLLGARGPDVIYCGDHLFGDVVRCRKLCEWRTMLVLPDLKQELRKTITRKTGSLFREGRNLSFFASQMMIWADIYTTSVCNLLNYSMQHRFIIHHTLPHDDQGSNVDED